MCDTLCAIDGRGTWFAKNSDRPIGEPQVVEYLAARRPGGELRTQYLTIPDAGARAIVGSRPTWLWGLEHGVNESGLAVGNERVWTTDPPDSTPGLIGMDLVRLALERCDDARSAVELVVELIDRYGQSGSCAHDHDDPYYSTFLVADPSTSYVLETSGRSWAAHETPHGTAISNRLTIDTVGSMRSGDLAPSDVFSSRNDSLSTLVSDPRLVHSRAALAGGDVDARSLVGLLRNHGGRNWGEPGSDPADVEPIPAAVGDDFSGVTICQHVEGVAVTAASMIARLEAGRVPQLFASLGSPCVSLFVPVEFGAVPDWLADEATWYRFDALRVRAEIEASELAKIRGALSPLESAAWGDNGTGDPHSRMAGNAVRSAVDDALTGLGV